MSPWRIWRMGRTGYEGRRAAFGFSAPPLVSLFRRTFSYPAAADFLTDIEEGTYIYIGIA